MLLPTNFGMLRIFRLLAATLTIFAIGPAMSPRYRFPVSNGRAYLPGWEGPRRQLRKHQSKKWNQVGPWDSKEFVNACGGTLLRWVTVDGLPDRIVVVPPRLAAEVSPKTMLQAGRFDSEVQERNRLRHPLILFRWCEALQAPRLHQL